MQWVFLQYSFIIKLICDSKVMMLKGFLCPKNQSLQQKKNNKNILPIDNMV